MPALHPSLDRLRQDDDIEDAADDSAPDDFDPRAPAISDAIVQLYEIVTPTLEALRQIVGKAAARRPADPAPPAIHAEAEALLADVRRILSREKGMGFLARPMPAGWGEIEARLARAAIGLAAFQQRYYTYDSRLGVSYWRTCDVVFSLCAERGLTDPR